MHEHEYEHDQLDRMIEASLAHYGEPPENGLAERILARVANEQLPQPVVHRSRSRFVLWAALPLAACLLLALLLWKSSGPTPKHSDGALPQTASANTSSKPPVSEDVGPRVTKTAPRTTAPTARRVYENAAIAADRPKRDVFPLPHPLSPEEKALYQFVTQVPEQQRQAVLAAQKEVDAPLKVAALEIQPLEMPDTGKN